MLKKSINYIFISSIFLIFAYSPVFSQTIKISKTPTPIKTEDIPILTIINPENDTKILGSIVKVTFIVNNFIFTDYKVRSENNIGEGHLHLWIDEQNPSPQNAQKLTKPTEITLEDVSPGKHELILELVNNDHSSFNPKVIKTVNFETYVNNDDQSATSSQDLQKDQRKKQLATMGKAYVLFGVGLLAILGVALVGFIIFRVKKHS